MVVLAALAFLILNPAFAVSHCYVGEAGVRDGDYNIYDEADLETLSGYAFVSGNLLIFDTTLISLGSWGREIIFKCQAGKAGSATPCSHSK